MEKSTLASPKSVLVIDDEVSTRAFRKTIERLGYPLEVEAQRLEVEAQRLEVEGAEPTAAPAVVILGAEPSGGFESLVRRCSDAVFVLSWGPSEPAWLDSALAVLGQVHVIPKPLKAAVVEGVLRAVFELISLRDGDLDEFDDVDEEDQRARELRAANLELAEANARLRNVFLSMCSLPMQSASAALGDSLLGLFAKTVGAQGGSIYVYSQRRLDLLCSLDPGHAPETIDLSARSGSVFAHALEDRAPVLIEHIDTPVGSGWSGYRDSRALIFPLHLEGHREPVGIVSLHNSVQGFSDKDLQLGAVISGFAAAAVFGGKTADEAREASLQHRFLVENVRDVLFSISPEGLLTYCSPAVKAFGGYDAESELGEHLAKYFASSDDLRKILTLLQSKDLHAVPSCIEFLYKPKSGQPFPVEISVRPILHSGQLHSVLCVMRDVSERVLANTTLRRQSQALQQSVDPILITTLDGEIDFVNQAWAQLHGYPLEEVQKDHIRRFLAPERSLKQHQQFVQRTLEQGWHLDEVEHVKKDGTRLPLRISASLLHEPSGKPIGMVEIARDLSKEKGLEAKLLHSQKLESIGRLAGGVAHDLNNLLSPILGYTELLSMDLDTNDPRYADLLEVQQAAHRASVLARQLLAFGRKQVLELRSVNLSGVVIGFEKILRRTLREDIHFKVSATEMELSIVADPAQLEQVIMNLVINAQDAMPSGGCLDIVVTQRTLEVDDEVLNLHAAAYAVLVVRDSGLGMSRETLTHLFEPFYTTKVDDKGTGLGLATSHGIVTQHGGAISVHSELGAGTTFEVFLPLEIDAAGGASSSPETSEVQGGHDERILVVEDDDLVRDLVVSALTTMGYQVCATADPLNALRMLNEGLQVDLLLTDVVLPYMNGLELFEKAVQLVPHLKRLLMSGYSEEIVSERGVNRAEDFIAKPISVRVLAKRVREALDRA